MDIWGSGGRKRLNQHGTAYITARKYSKTNLNSYGKKSDHSKQCRNKPPSNYQIKDKMKE